MSGSAGLAAAKRRRAGPSVNNDPPRRPSNTTPQPSVSQTPPNNIQNMHPLVILALHEQQLSKINAEIDEIRSNNRPVIHENKMDEESVHFFKSKYESLSQEMEDMKKLLIKIQTFSLESNLELLKMKRALKNDPRLKESDDDNVTTGLEQLSFNN